MICNEILTTTTLEELLSQAKDEEFPQNMGKKHYERYKELKAKFADYPVEMGQCQVHLQRGSRKRRRKQWK